MTLAVRQVLLDHLAGAVVYEGPDLAEQVSPLIEQLTEDEAERFYPAWGALLPVLAVDPVIAQVALETAVQLDMYEAAQGAIGLARQLPTAWAVLGVASLVAHPAVPVAVRKEGRELIESIAPGSDIARIIQIRLDPGVETRSDLEWLAQTQAWPGVVHPDKRRPPTAPTVYLALPQSLSKRMLQLSAALTARGANVRRLPLDGPDRLVQELLTTDFPIVVGDRAHLPQLQSLGVRTSGYRVLVADQPLTNMLAMSRILNQIASALPHGFKLRPLRQEVLLSAAAPLSPEGILGGAFDTNEVAFLGAARKRMVYDYAREGLTPFYADVQRWAFHQLIAVRVVQYFKSKVRRVISPATLTSRLAEAAAQTATSRVGVAADGEVFIEYDEGFTNLRTGQPAMTAVVELDAVFQPVELGGLRVPALLRPSEHTLVHPLRQVGTPTIAGTRVTARAVAELADSNGIEAVYKAYEDVPPAQLLDAQRVGALILNTP